LCCTVRGDLLRLLMKLAARRDTFDRVVIETTGLADPGPVVQTFVLDAEIAEVYRLDGIVTLVDARHAAAHLDDSDETKAQVGFADLILLNKVDLVAEADADALEARLRRINGVAPLVRSVRGTVPIGEVLDLGGFDVARALDHAPALLEVEHPFAWAAVVHAGRHVRLATATADHGHHHDHGHDHAAAEARAWWVFGDDVAAALERADRSFDALAVPLPASFGAERGPRVLFVDDPCGATVDGQSLEGQAFRLRHRHADGVGSVGFRCDGEIDAAKLDAWLGGLFATREPDLFRTKGILAIAGHPNRLVIQAVHATLETDLDQPWGDRPRGNTLVFIGRNLDRAELWAGFRSCFVA
jgi:G3E family GTPase